jgi:hypothetical protein
MSNQDWAVIVGISVYPDSFTRLKGSERDAEEFYDWVISPAGGAVPADAKATNPLAAPALVPDVNHVKLILSGHYSNQFTSLAEAKPAEQQVEQAFDEIYAIAFKNEKDGNGFKVGRRLYLFFSGHGLAPNSQDVGLFAADADTGRYGRHITGTAWAQWFFDAGPFEEVVLFMDCCRDYFPRVQLNPVNFDERREMEGRQERKIFQAFAAQWSSKSFERLMDDGKVHGVFSYALMQALRGAAGIRGEVTAASLRQWLSEHTKDFMAPADIDNPEISHAPYCPDYNNPLLPFVLAQVPDPDVDVIIKLPEDAVGKTVNVLNDRFDVEHTTVAESPIWPVKLKARRFFMAQVQGGARRSFEVPANGGTYYVTI